MRRTSIENYLKKSDELLKYVKENYYLPPVGDKVLFSTGEICGVGIIIKNNVCLSIKKSIQMRR